jgi:hypothetical protein
LCRHLFNLTVKFYLIVSFQFVPNLLYCIIFISRHFKLKISIKKKTCFSSAIRIDLYYIEIMSGLHFTYLFDLFSSSLLCSTLCCSKSSGSTMNPTTIRLVRVRHRIGAATDRRSCVPRALDFRISVVSKILGSRFFTTSSKQILTVIGISNYQKPYLV